MVPIEHEIKAIQQKTGECLQTAATQVISFFDPTISLDKVLESVPVYVENGEKIGTSPGHLAAYFAQQGYITTAHIFDVELFDRSWKDLSPADVLLGLRERQKYIPQNSWLAAYHHILVDGWELYVKAGGKFSFSPVSVKMLRDLLDSGPYLAMVNSTYLNQEAKQRYDKESDEFKDDAVGGRSLTHAVTCSGYREEKFLIVDSDPPVGTEHHRWIPQDHLIASIMAAQTESDNFLVTIKQP